MEDAQVSNKGAGQVAKIIWAVFLISGIVVTAAAWKVFGFADPNAMEVVSADVDQVAQAKMGLVANIAAGVLIFLAFVLAKKGATAGPKQLPLYLVRLIVLDMVVILGFYMAFLQGSINSALPIMVAGIAGFALSFPKFN